MAEHALSEYVPQSMAPIWARLKRLLRLGSGFQFCVLYCDQVHAVAHLQKLCARYLVSEFRSQQDIITAFTIDDLQTAIAQVPKFYRATLESKYDEQFSPVWLDLSRGIHHAEDQDIRANFARLNIMRTMMERSLKRPLILVLPTSVQSKIALYAPDIHHIRSLTEIVGLTTKELQILFEMQGLFKSDAKFIQLSIDYLSPTEQRNEHALSAWRDSLQAIQSKDSERIPSWLSHDAVVVAIARAEYTLAQTIIDYELTQSNKNNEPRAHFLANFHLVQLKLRAESRIDAINFCLKLLSDLETTKPNQNDFLIHQHDLVLVHTFLGEQFFLEKELDKAAIHQVMALVLINKLDAFGNVDASNVLALIAANLNLGVTRLAQGSITEGIELHGQAKKKLKSYLDAGYKSLSMSCQLLNVNRNLIIYQLSHGFFSDAEIICAENLLVADTIIMQGASESKVLVLCIETYSFSAHCDYALKKHSQSNKACNKALTLLNSALFGALTPDQKAQWLYAFHSCLAMNYDALTELDNAKKEVNLAWSQMQIVQNLNKNNQHLKFEYKQFIDGLSQALQSQIKLNVEVT